MFFFISVSTCWVIHGSLGAVLFSFFEGTCLEMISKEEDFQESQASSTDSAESTKLQSCSLSSGIQGRYVGFVIAPDPFHDFISLTNN